MKNGSPGPGSKSSGQLKFEDSPDYLVSGEELEQFFKEKQDLTAEVRPVNPKRSRRYLVRSRNNFRRPRVVRRINNSNIVLSQFKGSLRHYSINVASEYYQGVFNWTDK